MCYETEEAPAHLCAVRVAAPPVIPVALTSMFNHGLPSAAWQDCMPFPGPGVCVQPLGCEDTPGEQASGVGAHTSQPLAVA